ncbi:MAG: HAMP domain-containing histidine kinase [Candidatus Delongbacteria bacterium]|nr:HAMP domain-containing histidine kinase [Candidatus Delongbacteria bacterium]MBN2834326.1 HAMP domain-containing histidine kinase [Candidatus Delongbacteria bacterium]
MKLSIKLVLTMVSAILLLNILYFIFRISFISNDLENQFIKRMDNTLYTTIEGSKQSIYNLDLKNLNYFINTIFMDESVIAIIFESKKYVTSAYIKDEPLRIYNNVKKSDINLKFDDETVIREGVVAYNNLNEKVTIYFTKKFMKKGLAILILNQVYEFLITILLLIIFLYMAVRIIILKPIANLTNMSETLRKNLLEIRKALAEENYGMKIIELIGETIITQKKIYSDEFGFLQQTMIELAQTIQNSIRVIIKHAETLEKINNDLELTVIQRTEELQNSNDALLDTIESLKRAQNQIIQQEKMASLGSLVAGIAHEINTPVGIGVTAASHLIEKTSEINDKFQRAAMSKTELMSYFAVAQDSSKMILNNLSRAAELINSFKKVAVDQTSEAQRKFNFYQYLNEIILSLKPKLKKTKHNIEIDMANDLEIYSYPGVFSQIFTNLIMNSLTHGFENIESGVISIEAQKINNELRLIYKDNGKGADTNVVKKIFDPFFTTKRGSGGSGLGMNITYNLVVEKLKGSIVCRSEQNRYMEFEIYVPLND